MSRPWIFGMAVIVAASLLALAAFGWLPGRAQIWRLQPLPANLWLVGAAGMAVSYVCRALRLRAEWRGRHEMKAGRCLQVILIHAAAVNILPMRAGELGFPWLLNRHWRIPLADAASSLLWLRLQDMAVLAWLCALSALVVLAMNGAMDTVASATAAICVTALLAVWAMRGAGWSRALLARWRTVREPGGSRLRRWLGRAMSAAVQGSARAGSSTWAWSIANWVVKVIVLGGLLCALTGTSLPVGWCGALGGEVAGALPVQPPAGFGSYEAAVVLAATAAGSTAVPRMLAGAVMVHLFVLATSLAGAALAWMSVPRERDAPQTGERE
jgi:hypothetical protein